MWEIMYTKSVNSFPECQARKARQQVSFSSVHGHPLKVGIHIYYDTGSLESNHAFLRHTIAPSFTRCLTGLSIKFIRLHSDRGPFDFSVGR